MRLARPVIEAYGADGSAAAHPAAALYDPGELDEEVDLDLPRKRQILDLYYRLDSLSHYELFDISTDSDKKAIKSAYFGIVSLFHPDRYFGKKLGSFKPKLERIFAQAHRGARRCWLVKRSATNTTLICRVSARRAIWIAC